MGDSRPTQRFFTRLRHAQDELDEAKQLAIEEGLEFAPAFAWLHTVLSGAISELEKDIEEADERERKAKLEEKIARREARAGGSAGASAAV